MSDGESRSWDDVYGAEQAPPWEIERPQPAIVELADSGALAGRVLDVGCGTGEQALHLAGAGYAVTGVDLSVRAIERAAAKAGDDLDVEFLAADLFAYEPAVPFDTVLDCLLLHNFDGEMRARYVDHLDRLVAPDGRLFVLCFSDRADPDIGPATFAPGDLEALFGDGWAVRDVRRVHIESRPDSELGEIPGLLARVERD